MPAMFRVYSHFPKRTPYQRVHVLKRQPKQPSFFKELEAQREERAQLLALLDLTLTLKKPLCIEKSCNSNFSAGFFIFFWYDIIIFFR